LSQVVQKTLNSLSSADFVVRHKTSLSAFTRTRKFPFQTLCLFLLNLIKSSIQDELDEFFKVLNQDEFEKRTVSKSAFTQARKYLSYKAFGELSDQFIE